ncbi:TetR/AcrR family transcriptional regulator [Planomonospora sp. ID82291]|uniref:TetR/AcrR family transcriptional regulator n=1 Tax=Planomonospora sp. ID82291 TaxID=2738136 RepID=UPI0018C3EFB8|nr:TetR/AcrR family transcriptional regulator [Planomonospora sp. ID82291]MBG0815557.1 TetR/AcrR family transcriptional regulator [Planomonospora sp. ID82291]
MKSQRAELVAETAITLLAERGMRGLTHRAVDEAAGLPPGSTSNLARTRSALLELALARLTELEVELFSSFTAGGVGGDASEGAAGGAAGATGGPPVAEGAGDRGGGEPGRGRAALDALAEMMARALWAQLTVDRHRTVARYELALEATRRPELRAVYDRAGDRFREPAVALLAAAGSPDPVRHGRQLVAFGEGVMFDAIVGAGTEPTLDELRLGARELLAGMLSGGSVPGVRS